MKNLNQYTKFIILWIIFFISTTITFVILFAAFSVLDVMWEGRFYLILFNSIFSAYLAHFIIRADNEYIR